MTIGDDFFASGPELSNWRAKMASQQKKALVGFQITEENGKASPQVAADDEGDENEMGVTQETELQGAAEADDRDEPCVHELIIHPIRVEVKRLSRHGMGMDLLS